MTPRHTRQLAAVEAVLREARDHPTAAQIYDRVAARLPQVSLGTIYRNLEKLMREGCAAAVRIDGEVTRYDGTVDPHDHFVCRECGQIVDLVDGQGPGIDTRRLQHAGYAVRSHALTLFGRCPDCA